MIKQISRNQLPACLDVFHSGYLPVALEFGLTNENCPHRGRASLPFEKLVGDFDGGALMFGYFVGEENDEKLVGVLSIKMHSSDVCKLNDVVVMPEHQKKGYGTALLNFAKEKALEMGAKKVFLGMIDDNTCLKEWYLAHEFAPAGTQRLDGAPFVTGYMECVL